MRSPVVDLLADLVAALDNAKVLWYLFGAQAAILYGAARLTADVDVTVRLPDDMSHAMLAAIVERHGFRQRIADPAFIERTSVVPFVHVPTTMPLDIVIAGPGIEDLFFDRVVVREIDGVRIRVASPEDLTVMKVLAGRPKDLDDVVAILAAAREEIDIGYVRGTLRLLEEALAQSDLVPVFEQILHRARGIG